MNKNKIFIKLFAMTAGVVLIILSLQFIFQYFWLEKFYVYNKTQNLTNALTDLKEKIEKNSMYDEKVKHAINQVSLANDIFIGISDTYGMPLYGFDENSYPYILIKDANQEMYKVYMESFLDNQELLERLEKKKQIKIQGILQVNVKEVYPETITIDMKNFSEQRYDLDIESSLLYGTIEEVEFFEDDMDRQPFSTESMEIQMPEIKAIELNGIIVDTNLDDKENYGMEYRKDQLFKEYISFLDQEKNISAIFDNNKIFQYSKLDTFTGIKNMVFIQPLLLENKGPMLMFAVTSLQSINETTNIMKSYFLVVLLVAMLLAIIASYFYSKRITIPLLHLNDVTKKMAHLDFSQECKINSNDEIADLADNINIMSENLQKTLNKVKRSNEKLKEDIELKEKIEQYRKRFIADVSHELKTPLTVMKGVCEGIIDGIYDRKDNQHFKNILNEVNDMSRLVYDLLEISKLESGEVPLDISIFQLSDVVYKIHSKFKPLIENKNLQVSLTLSEDFVKGDENKLERVIGNLYHNAILYTPENGKIDIYMLIDFNICYFVIENSPAKIPKDDISKIWQPFYRVEKSRNRSSGGSGLGLYLAKEILEKNGCKYGIKNTATGVRVHFSLERVDVF